MSKNFRTRVIAGVVLFVTAMVAMHIFDGVPLKILYGLFALVAGIELISFFKQKTNPLNTFLALLEILFLIGGSIFVAIIPVENFWYIILGVCGYDIFAYLFGKALGGKIFKKSRPFRYVSKNKTWEGTILGLITSIVLVAILLNVRGTFETDWMYLLCGPLALIGDLFESLLKRHFKVKDSNEIVVKNKWFKRLELVVGGSEGHGGFLDRIDSTAFAASVLLIILLLK